MRADNGEVMVRRRVTFMHMALNDREVPHEDEEIVREIRGKPTRGRYPQGSYCLVGYEPDWDRIVQMRAEYLVWWYALSWLLNELTDLERIEVIGSELPQRPWQEMSEN
jgi:hypothetical protein